jgi:hypothetical protein
MTAAFRLTAPEPLERDVHESCARALDALLLRPAVWWPYPAGVTQLSPQQHAAYSRFGIKRGMPDLNVLYQGRLYGIELKRRGRKPSKTRTVYTAKGSPRVLIGQEEMFPILLAAGMVEIAIAHNVDEVLDHLARWQIPHRRFR